MADDPANEDAAPPSREDTPRQDDVNGVPPDLWPSVRRALLLGLAFVAPCAVIAVSVFTIVKGGSPHTTPMPSASAASVAFPADAEAPDPAAMAMASNTPALEKGQTAEPAFEDEGSDEAPSSSGSPAKPAPPKHFATVQDAAAGSCSTESVDGLSRQIIEQARCIKPNDFVALPKRPNLVMAAHVFPYLAVAARDHLVKALDAHTSAKMTVNSCLRTVAQQYLVSHWSVSKSCGVQLATPPGESNHEIGTALDIAEASKWRPALEAQDFKWLGTSDRVHFDYKGTGTPPQHTATDVLAFQKLWNRNHHEDPVNEDGHYTPATEQRLKKSPPSGFPIGASCAKASAAASKH
ncbi:MAG TPA: M15 family metallopeptidase [Polyangiaceae bacterium]